MRSRPYAVAALVTGCIAAAGAATPDTPAIEAPDTAVVLAGELTLARGHFGFAPCEGRPALAVDNTRARGLTALVRDRNDGGDGAVFVVGSIARSGDGGWRIDRVERAYREGPGCAESLQDFVWRAAGDGGWRLEVTRRRLTLVRPDEEPLRFDYRPFEADGRGNFVFAAAGAHGAVNIVLSARACTQGRSLYSYAASITTGGATLTGCAWNGAASAGRSGS